MRIFIAVEIPEKIKTILKDLQKQLNDGNAKVKWVNDFHLTLKFLGEISEVKLERVKERLKGITFKDFEAEFTNLGVFPSNNYINIVWIGLKPEKKIKSLQLRIDNALRDLFTSDNKFKAHITIGRVKIINDKKIFLEKLNNIIMEEGFTIKNFKLIKSTLKTTGPEYETLEVY